MLKDQSLQEAIYFTKSISKLGNKKFKLTRWLRNLPDNRFKQLSDWVSKSFYNPECDEGAMILMLVITSLCTKGGKYNTLTTNDESLAYFQGLFVDIFMCIYLEKNGFVKVVRYDFSDKPIDQVSTTQKGGEYAKQHGLGINIKDIYIHHIGSKN